ncbi:hypothetical protein P8452_68407 [Trifolium repens]|nr:hypothetical protein P8452_68407 [Trifolium repens]
MHFFFIVVLAIQETVMQTEACEIILFRYNYPCNSNSKVDSLFCNLVCVERNNLLDGGSCTNGKCMCYGKCI